MSKTNDREIRIQLKAMHRACRSVGLDVQVAEFGYHLGVYAALRVAVNLIAARDRLKAIHECGRLLALAGTELKAQKWPPANPSK